jgi:predicted kinase
MVSAESPGRLVLIVGLPGSGKTTLATELAASMPASRLCPDDWMVASGIDLWNEHARSQIEACQLTVALDLLRSGCHVVIEWGLWTRRERDAVRDAARAIGSPVELRFVTADADELWRRIERRDLEGRWGSRSIRREEFDEWMRIFEPPSDAEQAEYA